MIVLYILAALLILLALPWVFYWICSLPINSKKEYNKDSKFYRALLNFATILGLWLVRIKVEVSGMEKVPKDTRILLVSNHRSKFDPIISWYVFRKWNIAYLSKEKNFHIPIFGKIIRKCCFKMIDRENAMNAIITVNSAAELLKQREVSIGVYPEGTRSTTGEILPFHNGMFKIAQKGEAPVVVIFVDGTEKIHVNYPWHSTKVTLKVLEVMPYEEIAARRTAEIGEEVRALMQHELEENLAKENIQQEVQHE